MVHFDVNTKNCSQNQREGSTGLKQKVSFFPALNSWFFVGLYWKKPTNVSLAFHEPLDWKRRSLVGKQIYPLFKCVFVDVSTNFWPP